MGRYILRRLVVSVPVLAAITLAVYIMMNLAPGDPVMAMIDPETASALGPDWVETQREQLGLNQPMPVRYVLWLGQVARGNFGFSYNDRQPVSAKVSERFWPTLKLMGTAQAIALTIAVPLGILSAVRQYSRTDYVLTVLAFLAVSIPNFFLALGLIYIFAVTLGWTPTAGMGTIGGTGSFFNSLHHLILPASVLGLSAAAPLIRYVRSSMLETLSQDYVQVARAKGLHPTAVVIRHALRNALIPVVTIVALSLPSLIGGTVIVEAIFAWPGMGTLVITSLHAVDYPVIMAALLVIGIAIVISNLIADLLYALLDPRIRYS
ncbi:MAG TPA: ABC transporter permease [Thermomicrobiales bacterium]|nr:ABC transporter permease [Thermomicrobiales bacterium]